MRRTSLLCSLVWLSAAGPPAAGCSNGTRVTADAGFPDGSSLADGGVGDAAGNDGDTSRDASGDSGSSGGGSDAGPRPEDTLIYAHSRDALFTVSPSTLKVTEVGRFEWPDGRGAPFMLDLAVDGEGNVYTSSQTSLFEVDPETARVTEVGEFDLSGEQLNALSFLYEGAYREGEETLVGATNAGVYYEVDPATADTTYMGKYPEGWRSSGDIVSVEELGTYATALRQEQSDDESDILLEIEFAPDGSSNVSVKGPIEQGARKFTQLFGVGFWGRALYGFSNKGELVRIDRRSGEAELVSDDTGADQFWGAGVTTEAPVLF